MKRFAKYLFTGALLLGVGGAQAKEHRDSRDDGRLFRHGDRVRDRHQRRAFRRSGAYRNGYRGSNLPPGLEKHVDRTGHLPPGLEKKRYW